MKKHIWSGMGFLLAPLLLFGVVWGQVAPPAPAAQAAAGVIPSEDARIQQLSMEFRHPVADGALMRMICLIDAPLKNVLPAEEITAKGLDGDSFITCLGEFIGKQYADGHYQDIAEHYTPWTPDLEESFHALIVAQNLTAENDYGARAETVKEPAYNIVIAYKSGRSLHITAADKTTNGHEAVIEDAVLTWADDAFAAGGK